MLVIYVFDSVIFGISFSTGICVEREMEVEREKVERFSERVNVWVCVCVCARSLSDSQEMPHARN